MQSFFMLLLAAAVSVLVIPAARRLAPHIGMVDMPDPRKVHRAPVPRIGGWGIALGSMAPLLLLSPVDPAVRAWLAGSALLFAFGTWDDARQIGHWPKFMGQAIAAGIVVFYGDIYVTRLPFFPGDALAPAVGQLFTIVAVIGVINAINHSDGLDGLAGGETLLSLVAICFLGHLSDNDLVTGIALAVIGGIIGFLRFNTHPAIVFMGDAGSQFLGFTLAFLVIYQVQVASAAVSAALPLLLIGLPIADILAVLFLRMRGGMNWFKATRNHVHHRLLDLGLSHHESVVVIYSAQALLVACAVMLRFAADSAVVGVYLAVVVTLFALLTVAERSGWRFQRSGGWGSALTRLPQTLRQSPRLRALLLLIVSLPTMLFVVSAALWSSDVPRDFGLGAAAIAILLGLLLAFGSRAPGLAVRAAVYVSMTFAAFLFVRYPGGAESAANMVTNAVMLGLAITVVLYVRYVAPQRFDLTPTDYLIAFSCVALLLFSRFSGGAFGTERLLRFALYAVVLFYAGEVAMTNTARWRSWFGIPTIVALGIMGIRGIT